MPLNNQQKKELFDLLDEYFATRNAIDKKLALVAKSGAVIAKSGSKASSKDDDDYIYKFGDKTLKQWIRTQAGKRLPGKGMRNSLNTISSQLKSNNELTKQLKQLNTSLGKAGQNLAKGGGQIFSASKTIADPFIKTLIQSNPILYLMAQAAGPALGLAKGAFSLAKGGINIGKGLLHGAGAISEGVFSLFNTRKKVSKSKGFGFFGGEGQGQCNCCCCQGGVVSSVLSAKNAITNRVSGLLSTSLPMLPGPKQDDGIIDLVPDASGVYRAKNDNEKQRLLTDSKKKQNIVQRTLASINKNTLASSKVLKLLNSRVMLIAAGIGVVALAALGLYAWLKNKYGTPDPDIYNKDTKNSQANAGAVSEAISFSGMNLDTQMEFLRKKGQGVTGSRQVISEVKGPLGKTQIKPVMRYESNGITPILAPFDGYVVSVEPIFKGDAENRTATFRLTISLGRNSGTATVEPLIYVTVGKGQKFVTNMVLGYADKYYTWNGLEKLYKEDYGEFINKHSDNNFKDSEAASRSVMTPEYMKKTAEEQNKLARSKAREAGWNETKESSPATKVLRTAGWYAGKVSEDVSGTPTGGAAPVSSMNQATKNGQKVHDQSNQIQRAKNRPVNKGSSQVNTDGTKSKTGATGIQTASAGPVFTNTNAQLASVSTGNVFGITNG